MDKKRSQYKIPITFEHISSHANIHENEQVYLLAKNATQSSTIFKQISNDVIKHIIKKKKHLLWMEELVHSVSSIKLLFHKKQTTHGKI